MTLVVASIIIIFFNSYAFAAMELSPSIPIQQVRDDWENIDRPKQLYPIPRDSFNSFDVRYDGWIVLCYKDGVDIYDDNFNFLYSFIIRSHGAFCVRWEQDNLAIYDVRSDRVTVLNDEGKCIDARKVNLDSPSADSRDSWMAINEKNVRMSGNIQFVAEAKYGFLSGYTQLKRIDEVGNETILYDRTGSSGLILGCIVILIILFIAFVLKVVFRQVFLHSKS